jgi:hypothetical protein
MSHKRKKRASQAPPKVRDSTVPIKGAMSRRGVGGATRFCDADRQIGIPTFGLIVLPRVSVSRPSPSTYIIAVQFLMMTYWRGSATVPVANTYTFVCYYTYMAKLTLSVDNAVVFRAKQYAKLRGISVSEMVEAYLSAVAEPVPRTSGDTPVLRSLRGVLRNADVGEYRKHLVEKYR